VINGADKAPAERTTRGPHGSGSMNKECRGLRVSWAGRPVRGVPHTYQILNFPMGSFHLDCILLTEGSIVKVLGVILVSAEDDDDDDDRFLCHCN
jgi:hypothetical protein